jgi:glycosidase
VPDADYFNPTPGNPDGNGNSGGYGYGGDGGSQGIPPDATVHLCYRDADCASWQICDLASSPQACIPAPGRCASDEDCDTAQGEKCDADRYCAMDACEGVECSNGGVCSTEGNQAVCNCPHGYVANGTNCESAPPLISADHWCGVQWAGQWQDKGFGATLQYEKDQGPPETDIYGQIWIDGVTDSASACLDGHRMQLGVTSRNVTYPIIAGHFDWLDMDCNGDRENNDEFKGSFPTDIEGTFSWILRFSPNDGVDWIYCDASPGIITSATMTVGTASVGEGGGGGDGPIITPTGSWLGLSMKHPTNGSSQTGAYEFTVEYKLTDDPTQTLPNAKITRNGVVFNFVEAFLGQTGGIFTKDSVIIDFTQMDQGRITIKESGLPLGKYTWLFRLEGYKALYVPIWVEPQRFTWEDGLLYQVMTDRFANGDTSNDAKVNTENPLNDWMGGDHKGLTQKMREGFFDELSVNTIWISSPIIGTDGYGLGVEGGNAQKYAAYHAYWPIATGWTDTNQQMFIDAGIATPIEPHFGSEDDLREFIQLAHSKGIRVLVDFVANHVFGISNPLEASGSQSPLWPLYKNQGWFNVDPIKYCGDYTDGVMNYDHTYWTFRCWFNAYLADFDFDGSQDALNLVLDHAIWLAQEFDVDGFRLDAVKHMSMKFTTGIRARIKEELETTGLTFFTVGETFDGNEANLAKWIGDDKLTGQFSFAFYYKILNPLLGNNGSYGDMGNGIAYLDTYFRNLYGQAIMPNFMGNHDVERALRLAGGNHDRLRRAQTIVMTSPEMPLIYQGDDFGMDGGKDPDNRRMMKFENLTNDEQTTFSHLKKLAKARKDNKAFRYGRRTNCATQPDVWVYKMERDGDTAVVGINRSGSDWTGSCANASGTLKDVISGATSTTGQFTVPRGGSAVYVRNAQ